MPEIQLALPKFMQIANSLRDEILRGQRKPGDELPSERELAAEWGVARPTATRALAALRSQGLAISRQGAGTFVRSQLDLSRRAADRYGMARIAGRIYPDGEWAEIVSARLAKAPPEIAEALGLEAGSKAAKRHRITHTDTGPVEVSTSWFSPAVAEAAPRVLVRERIREGTLSYVEACTGRRARTARDQVSARLATETEARELDLASPAAVLVVHHVVYDGTGHPIEAAQAVYPPDSWLLQHEYAVGD